MRNLHVRRSSAFKRSIVGPGAAGRAGLVRKWGEARPPAAPKSGWAGVLDYVGDVFNRGGAGSVQKNASGELNTRELFGAVQTKFGSAMSTVSYDVFAATLAKNADTLGIGISLPDEIAWAKAHRANSKKAAPEWGDVNNTAFVEREIAGTTDPAINLGALYDKWTKLLSDKNAGTGPTVAKSEWVAWAGTHLQEQDLGRFIPEKSLFMIEEGPALTQKRFEKRLFDLESDLQVFKALFPKAAEAAKDALEDAEVTPPAPTETDERREVISTLAEVASAMKAMKEDFATEIANLKKGARRGGDTAFTPAPSGNAGVQYQDFASHALVQA
jgi:hypothetical protein